MSKTLEDEFAKCAALGSEVILRQIAKHELTPLVQLVYCNELIKRGIYQLPIISFKGLIASLSDKHLKAAIWDELHWTRLTIGLLYKEANRRKLPVPDWFVLIDGEQTGPITRQELESTLQQRSFNKCLIWREGYSKWMPVSSWNNLTEPVQTVVCERVKEQSKPKVIRVKQQPLGLSVLNGIVQFIEFPFWIALFFFALFTSYNSFTGLLLPLVFCVFMIFMSIPLGVGLMARRTWAWNLKIVTALLTILWFLNIFLIDGKGHFWIFAALLEAIILTFVLLAKPSTSQHE